MRLVSPKYLINHNKWHFSLISPNFGDQFQLGEVSLVKGMMHFLQSKMNSSGLIRPVSTFLFLIFACKTYISLATGYIQSIQGTRQRKSFIKLRPTWWIVIYKLTPSELSLCSQRKKPSFCPPVKSTESKVCVYKSRDRKRYQDGVHFLRALRVEP